MVGLWWVFGVVWGGHQRSTKDPPKIQHRKNEEHIDVWWVLGDVMEASWSVLGRHVGVLGASWRYLVPDVQSKGDSI